MGFPASELKAVEYDEADDSRPPVIRTTFMGLYGVDSPLPTAYLDDIAQHREGHEALQGLLDIFSHRIMTQFYRIWRKYSWPATFEPGGHRSSLAVATGPGGLGIPGTTQHIASPASRFLALTGVLRQPGKTQQGIQALVTLLAPETTVRVSPYSLRPVAISQPLGFYGDDDFFLDGNTPLGDEAMDASSQLLVALTTDNPAEAQGWKPDGPLFRTFSSCCGIPRLAIPGQHHPDRADPTAGCPAAGGRAVLARYERRAGRGWRARVRAIFLRPLPPSWVPIRACSLPPFYKETDVLRISLTKTACLLPLLALCLSGCGLTQRVSEGTKSAFNAVFYKKINTLHLDFYRARSAQHRCQRESLAL
ncbi:type VI secretion protein [Klebsiella pneumoniae]|nr:type VI secretion protein [Klebsiella pneumoniae]